MKRGEIWTVMNGEASGPRPVVIVQDDSFDGTNSVTVCAFTNDQTDAPLFRLPIDPSARNGLRSVGRLMADTITTVSKSRVAGRICRLDDEDIARLNQAILLFLGLAVSLRGSRPRKLRKSAEAAAAS